MAGLSRIWNARHKLTRLLRYALRTRRFRQQVELPADRKVVFVHLTSQLRYRFFEQILRTLNAAGYAIFYVVPSLRDLVNLGRLDGDIFWTPGVTLTSVLPAHTDLYDACYDGDCDPLSRHSWRKTFRLEFDLAKDRDSISNAVYIPFSVHDYIYRCCFHRRTELLRNPKKIRLLFAGAYAGYANGPIGRRLGKMERGEIVDVFRTHEHTVVITSSAELEAVLRGPRTTNYYWIDTARFRVPAERWLEILSYVEVFLCPPGVTTPMSHNAIESMAMGAIPLINYPEWFHPRLVDDVSCLAFSDTASLAHQLDSIRDLPDEELGRLRRNALDYYEQSLDLDSIVGQLNRAEGAMLNLVLDVERSGCTERISEHSLAVSL